MSKYLNNNKKTKYYIYSRSDRYGSNCIQWIPALFLCLENERFILEHNCKHCKRHTLNNTVIHNFLLNNSIKNKSIDSINLSGYKGTFLEQQIKYVIGFYNNKPFPDVFHNSNTHKKIIELYKETSNNKKWNIPNNIYDSIVIHVRLDDKRNDIDKNNNRQSFIGFKKLCEVISTLQKMYKSGIIYLMTSNNKTDIDIINNFIKNCNFSNIKLISNSDKDNDIFIMSQCKLLIMSKSTFSLIGGLLNINNLVYTYDKWWHYNDLLGTNYNLSQKFKILQK